MKRAFENVLNLLFAFIFSCQVQLVSGIVLDHCKLLWPFRSTHWLVQLLHELLVVLILQLYQTSLFDSLPPKDPL